ncbi:hypothetical protein PYW08_012608 [Mythimna loreyi]|uniref:Uncharacterized protein n=1 Tax=Mythimna loreyi TaxID=667449 RepID=A0ACC2Q1J0_9NEOP|nr:hypothetical protein PYW08_012608 [Mythimna loreyi]
MTSRRPTVATRDFRPLSYHKKSDGLPPDPALDRQLKKPVNRKLSRDMAHQDVTALMLHDVSQSTINDFRELLRERSISFHTYSLLEDTPTRVVRIRRVPKEILTEDIKFNILVQSIPVKAIHRLQKTRGWEEYDMVPCHTHHLQHYRGAQVKTGLSIFRCLNREAFQVNNIWSEPLLPTLRPLPKEFQKFSLFKNV